MESTGNVESIFADLDKKVDQLFEYQLVMTSYQSVKRDYGTGIYLSEMEAHILLYIECEPGITAKEIAKMTHRTKGTISILISSLEKHGLITQQVNPQNRRERNLYLTGSGQETCLKHRAYDRKTTMEIILWLSKDCVPEEINGFFKVLNLRTAYFNKIIEEEKNK
ncbi:MarR family winged helix-turn-helix transcriptional regulator [Caproicibacter sp. BJN0012]|uniref:MarR family winged helix-turn-helix transcriptional regulator n=1 Tax=Caproicibacter sp. BJN0012 TaxID=3110227 RepID=UPI002E140B5A|nr:MarR family transcriptional regulator [Caproicibacter sp. BJN0012]